MGLLWDCHGIYIPNIWIIINGLLWEYIVELLLMDYYYGTIYSGLLLMDYYYGIVMGI